MNDKETENTVHGLRTLALIMLIICVITVSLSYLVSFQGNVAVLGDNQKTAPTDLAPMVSTSPKNTKSPVLNPKNVSDARVTLPGYSSLSAMIIDEGAVLNTQFYNPPENENLYYLVFEIRLAAIDGTYKTIYTSDRCYSGEQISRGKLEGNFVPGTYDVILFLQPYRISDDTPTNNSEQVLKLYIN